MCCAMAAPRQAIDESPVRGARVSLYKTAVYFHLPIAKIAPAARYRLGWLVATNLVAKLKLYRSVFKFKRSERRGDLML